MAGADILSRLVSCTRHIVLHTGFILFHWGASACPQRGHTGENSVRHQGTFGLGSLRGSESARGSLLCHVEHRSVWIPDCATFRAECDACGKNFAQRSMVAVLKEDLSFTLAGQPAIEVEMIEGLPS